LLDIIAAIICERACRLTLFAMVAPVSINVVQAIESVTGHAGFPTMRQ
jgi:hypothetical protein